MENLIFYGRKSERGRYEKDIDYYLVEESISEEYTDMLRYGIRIEQSLLYPGSGKTMEMRQLNNVFYHYDEADSFMRALMKEKVPPDNLKTYIDGYIMQQVSQNAFI